MTEAEILAEIRIGMREAGKRTVTDTVLSSTILRGVIALGLLIEQADPAFSHKRASCTSETFVFPWPSNCITIRKVWDMGTTAGTITDATNASPIVITEAAHGRSTDGIVLIHDIVGNTAANNVWKITKIDADSYSLNGSTGNAAYTSGGKVFKELADPEEITKINLSEANLSHSNKWYPRGKTIVIDDLTFTNDIIVDYIHIPAVITDIPSEYHDGLVAFGVMKHLRIPLPTAPDYEDKKSSLAYQMDIWQIIENKIKTVLKASSEPSYIRDVMGL